AVQQLRVPAVGADVVDVEERSALTGAGRHGGEQAPPGVDLEGLPRAGEEGRTGERTGVPRVLGITYVDDRHTRVLAGQRGGERLGDVVAAAVGGADVARTLALVAAELHVVAAVALPGPAADAVAQR